MNLVRRTIIIPIKAGVVTLSLSLTALITLVLVQGATKSSARHSAVLARLTILTGLTLVAVGVGGVLALVRVLLAAALVLAGGILLGVTGGLLVLVCVAAAGIFADVNAGLVLKLILETLSLGGPKEVLGFGKIVGHVECCVDLSCWCALYLLYRKFLASVR